MFGFLSYTIRLNRFYDKCMLSHSILPASILTYITWWLSLTPRAGFTELCHEQDWWLVLHLHDKCYHDDKSLYFMNKYSVSDEDIHFQLFLNFLFSMLD